MPHTESTLNLHQIVSMLQMQLHLQIDTCTDLTNALACMHTGEWQNFQGNYLPSCVFARIPPFLVPGLP